MANLHPARKPHHKQDLSANPKRATGSTLIETPAAGYSSIFSPESCPRADGPRSMANRWEMNLRMVWKTQMDKQRETHHPQSQPVTRLSKFYDCPCSKPPSTMSITPSFDQRSGEPSTAPLSPPFTQRNPSSMKKARFRVWDDKKLGIRPTSQPEDGCPSWLRTWHVERIADNVTVHPFAFAEPKPNGVKSRHEC